MSQAKQGTGEFSRGEAPRPGASTAPASPDGGRSGRGRDRAFRPSNAPVMQARFFGLTFAPMVICALVIFMAPELIRYPWARTAMGLAVLCLAANVPWLLVCHWMRRRYVRRLGWLEAGGCGWCGYDLRATPGVACPECGRSEGACRAEVERGARKW